MPEVHEFCESDENPKTKKEVVSNLPLCWRKNIPTHREINLWWEESSDEDITPQDHSLWALF